jgi:hypothetical protein
VIHDLKIGQSVKPSVIRTERATFRNGTTYVLLPPARPGFVPLIYEFTRVGARFRLDAMGKADHSSYAGLFADRQGK